MQQPELDCAIRIVRAHATAGDLRLLGRAEQSARVEGMRLHPVEFDASLAAGSCSIADLRGR